MMNEQNDYILKMIEQVANMLRRLLNKKTKQDIVEVDQLLSEITGIDLETINNPNALQVLPTMINLLSDENAKVLACILLAQKDYALYKSTIDSILSKINLEIIEPKVKESMEVCFNDYSR